MRCTTCDGRGWNPKHKNCYHTAQDAYVRGCNDERVCHLCLGTGSKGAPLIKAVLLEIKLESKDCHSSALAAKALAEFTVQPAASK